ncbi:MAG: hypothetical protein JST54_33035 [Deltaproteobacteria bacterium]|nr:hypothetical protein [Deltaproteobacteria bacterium]
MRTAAAVLLSTLMLACSGKSGPTPLTRDQLLDPATCANCHADHYAQWAASVHAHASDDPVFLAMNARGQRETNGALGSFCVNCHAPLAVYEGATSDGLNLASVDPKLKGVTCFFCHTVDSVSGAHNNPLHLADDAGFKGSISDPIAAPHGSAYSLLLDRNQLGSSTMCGACHDIVSPHGAAIERTFEEWQLSAFSASPGGTTCGQCHMNESTSKVPIANVAGAPARNLHAHQMDAVDLVPGDGGAPDADQLQRVQQFLDATLQSSVCVRSIAGQAKVEVILDNVAAGHGFPSGAAQDRRFWAEVHAFADGGELYASGDVSEGGSVTALNDVWLLRDCMFDGTGAQVDMFWDAASTEGNELPGQATFDSTDPRFYQSHLAQTYPLAGGALASMPDEVTLDLWVQPIGRDVLDNLVQSGDLDPSIAAAAPQLPVNARLTWTPHTANTSFVDPSDGALVSCVSATGLNPQAATVPAPKNARCSP